jgi:glutathione S-transferase
MYVDLVIVAAIAQFFFFAAMVAVARGRYKVVAPAVSGHPLFERYYRVQMNTLELLIMFLPSLLVAAKYHTGNWVPVLGAVYIIGRFIYYRSYVREPAGRALGFGLSMLPILILLVSGAIGALRQLLGQ